MENNVGDTLHCEEQLRTTLHCDDKEKLRRKLAQLQREYLRTAQKLQRAERLDTVRRHVRSTIAQQNHQDHIDPEVTSNHCPNNSSLIPNTSNATAPGSPQCQRHIEGPADSVNSRRSQVIRFLLPSDAASPQTSGRSHDAVRGHRPSPALRLRSRRSRLRWERRSTVAGKSTDSGEKVQEQSERMESPQTAEEEEKMKSEGLDVANESEELFSGTDSESPSLLLTHWNTHGHTETGDMEGKEFQRHQDNKGKETKMMTMGNKQHEETTSVLLTGCKPVLTTEEKRQDVTQNGRKEEVERREDSENSREQTEMRPCEENNNKEEKAAEKTKSQKSCNNSVEMKEEKNGIIGEEKAMSLLDSCTLVEGLLFPVEYYVRTTRRMTFSQSQPDMQAVILSQLSIGRPRRSRGRGRGRGLNRSTHTNERTDQHSQTHFSSQTTASTCEDPLKTSVVRSVDASAEHSQSSCEISAYPFTSDACCSPTVTPSRPVRGRRRKRGRGRGRPQTPRSSLSLDTHQLGCEHTSDDHQPSSTPASSSQSLHGADGPKLRLTPGEAALDEPQPASTPSSASQPPSNTASGHLEKVYPIFLKSSVKTKRSPQINRSTLSWRSLLLPSSPLAQTSLFPLPSLSPGPLVNRVLSLDVHQDFHLPDDQFASLKLHKLRQVTVDSGLERFSSPSYNTRSSGRLPDSRFSPNDTAMRLPLPLSLTPTIKNSPQSNEEQRAASQSVDVQNLSTEHEPTDKPRSQSLTEEPSNRIITETSEARQTEDLHVVTHTSSTGCVMAGREWASDCVEKSDKRRTVTPNSQSLSCMSTSSTHTSINHTDRLHTQVDSGEVSHDVIGQSGELKIKHPASEKQTACCGVVHPSEDQRSVNLPVEDQPITETPSSDCPLQETPEELSNRCTALQVCNDVKAPPESPVMHVNDSGKLSEPNPDLCSNNCSPQNNIPSQLLLRSPLASAPCHFVTPHLPSLGLTPHCVTGSLLLTSPSAPSLTLPPPHSPSTQALSPPPLSPCPSITYLPHSPVSNSPARQVQASSEPAASDDQCHRVEPAPSPTPSNAQLQGSGGQAGLRTEETAEEHTMRLTHTLEAAAGGFLVDACCFLGSSGGLCVAAAGKWAVCLWSQTTASDWSLTHTWTFNEPVISVFPVLDAAGLMCVTLGQLEIREVRVLSCSSFTQTLFCEGVVQAVVGVSESRVVTSSHSATGSSLQVFMLSDSSSSSSSSSSHRSQPLVSPGVCVGALAPVDGLSDAVIGTDEGGHLFVWNLKTGQLLCRVFLGHGLSHTACLRGYSSSGVLFVLLQHHFLSSLEEEENRTKMRDGRFPEEETKNAMFTLVAVNPLCEKSIVTARLYPPEAWSGRLCEADVTRSSVVGLSQSGCVCVWELGRREAPRMVWAPESEGWQLARWGGGDTLVTGHHNGDVSLHRYSRTSLNTQTLTSF